MEPPNANKLGILSTVSYSNLFLCSFFFRLRFYSSPYSIATNRMIAQTSITPFIAASPVSTYQVSHNALECR